MVKSYGRCKTFHDRKLYETYGYLVFGRAYLEKFDTGIYLGGFWNLEDGLVVFFTEGEQFTLLKSTQIHHYRHSLASI